MRVQGIKTTPTVDEVGKERKATIQVSGACPHRKESDQLSSRFPNAVNFKLATEHLEQMMYRGGDTCRNQGRTGCHLAAPLSAPFCLLQSLFCPWLGQTPPQAHPRAPVHSAGAPGVCTRVHYRKSQMAMGLHLWGSSQTPPSHLLTFTSQEAPARDASAEYSVGRHKGQHQAFYADLQ